MKKLPVPTAKNINEAHRLARSTAESAVEYAVQCGQLLAAKKEELKHGEFQQWVEKNCEFSYRTGAVYMKAADQKCRGLHFSSLNQLLADTSAPKAKDSPKGAVSVVKPQGTEETGKDRLAAPVFEPDPDAPERPDDIDEDAALAAAEADYARRVSAVMGADDKLAEASAQLKQQAALIGTLEMTRDGFMRGKEAVTKMLQAEQRKVAKLERELERLRAENESLRERVAIMDAA